MKSTPLLALFLLLTASLASAAVLTTVATSGYDQDIVYEKGLLATDTGKISTAFGSRAFFEGGAYATGAGLTQTGNTKTLTSGNTANFNFQPFSGSNVLNINGTNLAAAKTLNFSGAATAYTSLGFVATTDISGTALATYTYTINYSTGVAGTGTFTVGNWGNPSTSNSASVQSFITAGGRAAVTGPPQGTPSSSTLFGDTSNTGSDWYISLFEAPTDSTRTITSVSFYTNGATGSKIFGIVGAAIPEPSSAVLGISAMALGLILRRRK